MEKEKELLESPTNIMEDENFDLSLADNLIEYSNPNSTENMDLIEEDDGIDHDKENPNETDDNSHKDDPTKSVVASKLSTSNAVASTTNSTAKQTIPPPSSGIKPPLSGSIKLPGHSVQGITKLPSNVVKSAGGQIVIIQTPSGAKQSIRLASSTTQGIGTGHGYQLIKTAEGSIIQIRNDKSSGRPMLSNVSQLSHVKRVIVPHKMQNSVAGKFIYKGISVKGNDQQIMISTPPTKAQSTASSTSNPTTVTSKAITLSEAQQMGIFSSGKIKQIVLAQKSKPVAIQSSVGKNIKAVSVSHPPLSPNTPSPQVLTNAIKKLAPIQPKITMPMIKSGNHVKKIIPSGMIKVATSSGSLGGKGVQYVRFVPVSSSSSNTSTTTTMAGKIITGTKLVSTTSGSHTSGQGQKILIQGKQVALIQSPNSSGQSTLVQLSQQITKPSGTKVLQTISMPRKILPISKIHSNTTGETVAPSQKLIAVVKKDDNANSDGKSQKVTTITPSQLSQLQGTSIIPGNNKSPPIVMLPSNFVQQLQQKNVDKKKDPATFNNVVKIRKEIDLKMEIDSNNEKTEKTVKPDDLETANRRKPCNCTRSQCLKLYCDCFANGEFCSNCNCRECFNNLANEEERQKAIRICLERNPNAFRPKIGKAKDKDQSMRHHTKGCNCKRSGCLKNYCECYEAKISCSQNCKCVGCRNNDEFFERSNGESTAVVAEFAQPTRKTKYPSEDDKTGEPPSKQPYNFMTPDVIDATVQCMIAQAEECQRKGLPAKAAEKFILEEFGRCLVEIIDFSINNAENTEND